MTAFVFFPQKAVDEIECGRTGKMIPAVLVARSSASAGYVHCPHCSLNRSDRVWHRVDIGEDL